jgi:hypothetical protein
MRHHSFPLISSLVVSYWTVVRYQPRGDDAIRPGVDRVAFHECIMRGGAKHCTTDERIGNVKRKIDTTAWNFRSGSVRCE